MDVDQTSSVQEEQLGLVKKSPNEDQIDQQDSKSLTLQKKSVEEENARIQSES